MKRRLTVSLKHRPAMHVTRVSLGTKKLVYVIVADRKQKYATGRSRIVYIGTTKKGLGRIARSAAYRALTVLDTRGVQELDVRIVTCRPRQNVETWKKLERAMLLAFRDRHGDVPLCNTQGRRMRETDEFHYFARPRIRRILEDLS